MADYLDEFSSAEMAADFTLRDLDRFLKAQGVTIRLLGR